MGRGGIYFRQTLPDGKRDQPKSIPDAPTTRPQGIDFKQIESADVTQMVDSSSAALLEEINSKARKQSIWPVVLAIELCLLIFILLLGWPNWTYCLLTPICIVAPIWAAYRDKLRKTVVLFYDLEPHIEEAYLNLHRAIDALKACARMWHVQSEGRITSTYDWKVNSGASSIVKRDPVMPNTSQPSSFMCNVEVPSIPAGQKRLSFLPDRVLVWDGNGVGAIDFDQFEVSFREERFIEDNGVPSDAKVVGKTWRYANKKGGPDRRFNNNREIPVVLYESILTSSKSGLQELFQTSRLGIGKQLGGAIAMMAAAIAKRDVRPADSFSKCSCESCGLHIEFPTEASGTTVPCPHCGAMTLLSSDRCSDVEPSELSVIFTP